jgi:hypothetical protein
VYHLTAYVPGLSFHASWFAWIGLLCAGPFAIKYLYSFD